MSANQPETPSFLSQFQPPVNPRKKVRTTNQLQVFKFCDYIAEVCYFRAEIQKIVVGGVEKITAKKATLILTDYTEHADLPYQDVEERPTGRASIIATLWDEHCQAAQDANLSMGDLVSLKNLVPKMSRNGHIELDMHGNRRYQVINPVQKLGSDHADVQELLLRKHKYLEHINEEFVAAQMAVRVQQRIGPAVQGLGTASIEPGHDYEPRTTNTPGPTYQELRVASIKAALKHLPEPQSKRTPTPHRDSTARPSPDPELNLHLPVHSRLSANASSTAPAAMASTSTARSPHAVQPAVNTSFDSDYGEKYEQERKNVEVLPVAISNGFLDAEPTASTTRSLSQDLSPLVDTSPIKRESISLVAVKTEEAPEVIQPDVGTPLEGDHIFPIKRKSSPLVAVKKEAVHENIQPAVNTSVEPELNGPSERETSALAAARLEVPPQDIQPVLDASVEPESSLPAEPKSTPLVAVKLEPDCQDGQPTVSLAYSPAPPTQESVIVRTSPTFVLTEKAKEAKKGGCCLMPLRARVVGFEPETLIDFSGPVCRECKHKYRPRSKTKPSRRCPGCNIEDAVEFKYRFKLNLMDELDEPYPVDVDDEHATTLLGVPAGDLVKDFEKLEMVKERLARIGVSEVRNQDEEIFFDLCVQEYVKRLEGRKETMGASRKRTGSPLPSRESKRHVSGAQELDGPEWCQTPPPSPLSVEKKNAASTGSIISVEWSLVFTEIMKAECDRIEEGACEDEYYDCQDYHDAANRTPEEQRLDTSLAASPSHTE